MYSKELYQEMKNQGANDSTSEWIAKRFQTKEQEHTMMEYLKSIRQEYISEVEVIVMGRIIAETI